MKDSQTWQQQWQRAQAAGWFCRSDRLAGTGAVEAGHSPRGERPAYLAPASQAAAPVSSPMLLRQSSVVAAREGKPAAQARAETVASPAPAALPQAAAADHQLAELPPATALPAGAHAGAATAEADVVEMRAVHPNSSHKEEPAPMRVHVEEGSQGVHFWLGLDGTAAEVAARARALAVELRRECGRSGFRLAAVVCNGVPVSLARKET